MRAARSVRLAAVLAGGAFALHQLRYLIAPSGDLGPQGHGYMTALLPPIAVLLLAAVIATLIRGTEGACPARPPLGRRVALFAVALLAIYTGQETLERLMAGGGPGDLAAALTDGGWISIPLALAMGTLAALLATALEALERTIALVHAERPPRRRAPAVRGRPLTARGLPLPSAPLAFGLARRPPPLTPA